jgi:hypothetical protein
MQSGEYIFPLLSLPEAALQCTLNQLLVVNGRDDLKSAMTTCRVLREVGSMLPFWDNCTFGWYKQADGPPVLGGPNRSLGVPLMARHVQVEQRTWPTFMKYLTTRQWPESFSEVKRLTIQTKALTKEEGAILFRKFPRVQELHVSSSLVSR